MANFMSSNLIKFAKNKLVNLPFPIGKAISFLPFGLRPVIGSIYRKRKGELKAFSEMDNNEKESFIFDRVKNIAVFAYENVDFYNTFYKDNNFNPHQLSKYSDLNNIPIINKGILQKYSLSERTNHNAKGYTENTGGSSGQPFELMIQPSSVGHEWAHMHVIWSKVGFKPSNLRVVFSGRSNIKEVIQYDSARHQLNVDTYVGWEVVAERLLQLYDNYKPTYLHGYPSAIFDFILWLKTNSHPLLPKLRSNIKGLLLGSEYPNPILRSEVEEYLNCDSVSWYGHTERCVLAYEKSEKQEYCPFQTYGYTEAVNVGAKTHLVATSYYNFSHPFIRYDTEDSITIDSEKNSLLSVFSISQGRDGEYIIDRAGNKIFLTAFIFGRHHKLFDHCTSIQVKQLKIGEVIVYYVLRSSSFKEIKVNELFDSNNIDLSITFSELKEPIKTVSGKAPLLVR